MPALQNLIGRRFGRLIVIKFAFSKGRAFWQCLCDCGVKKTVSATHLKSRPNISCGCGWREAGRKMGAINGKLNKRHGHTVRDRSSRTYRSWQSMIQRCLNSNNKDFATYGNVGVKICKRWKRFEYFLADMGLRPKGKTLDRFPNPHGNYKPSNCRWATPKQQANNRRRK